MAELRLPQSLRAPAKLNLGLRVGARRESGLHELRSLFCPLELSDRLHVSAAETDEVLCDALAGPNIAERALVALREAGWDAPPLQIEIDKRIPVAAGLGGGSADAAAVLRLAAGEVERLERIAFGLGSDVPSQLRPRACIVAGTGERVAPVELGGSAGVVLIPGDRGLGAGEVYAKADELGRGSPPRELERWERELRARLAAGSSPLELGDLLANDLEDPALELEPAINGALTALRDAGAAAAFVCGSGPTVAGLFSDIVAADAAAAGLGPRFAGALVSALDPGGGG